MSVKVEEKEDGIFIPRELLDELEIEEANVYLFNALDDPKYGETCTRP